MHAMHFIFDRNSKVAMNVQYCYSFVLRWSLLILHSFTVDRVCCWSYTLELAMKVLKYRWPAPTVWSSQVQWAAINSLSWLGASSQAPFQPSNLVASLEVVSVFWCLHGISHGAAQVSEPESYLLYWSSLDGGPRNDTAKHSQFQWARTMWANWTGKINVMKRVLKQIYTIHHPPCNFIELERDAHPSVS